MKNLFDHDNYVEFLKTCLEAHKSTRGYHRLLASEAECSPPYLSTVIRGQAHLLPDHAYNLCQFWNFDQEETDFFLLLLAYARASKRKYKEDLKNRIANTRRKRGQLSSRISAESVQDQESIVEYYSDWACSAVHILVSTGNYSTPSAIADALSLPESKVRILLNRLIRIGVVARTGTNYQSTKKHLHISPNNPMYQVFHSSWRSRLASNPIATSTNHTFSYTAAFACSRSTFKSLYVQLRNFFDEFHASVSKSEEEVAGFLCLDLDKLGK